MRIIHRAELLKRVLSETDSHLCEDHEPFPENTEANRQDRMSHGEETTPLPQEQVTCSASSGKYSAHCGYTSSVGCVKTDPQTAAEAVKAAVMAWEGGQFG